MAFKMKYPIKNDFLPINTKRRSGTKIKGVKFLVEHDTGNPNSTAQGNVNYYKTSANVMSASAHVFIDEKEIIVCVPLTEKAWHVLYNTTVDNKLFGADSNDYAIGIELCYFPNDKTRSMRAYEKYVWYSAYLCNLYSLNPLKHITGHHILDPARKTDPVNALKHIGKTFNDLLNDINKELIECRQNKGDEIIVSEQTLNAAQEAVRKKAIGFGITDGKNAFREANQYYIWNALIPAYEKIQALEKEIKELKAKIK